MRSLSLGNSFNDAGKSFVIFDHMSTSEWGLSMGISLMYLEHIWIYQFDTRISVRKYVEFCIQNCDCISFLNLRDFEFTTSTNSVEV